MNAGIIFAAVMDGPNVHFGEHNSVSTILKIAMTRDFSHCSALAVTHHTKGIPEMFSNQEADVGDGRGLQTLVPENDGVQVRAC